MTLAAKPFLIANGRRRGDGNAAAQSVISELGARAALTDGRLASGSHDNTIRLWDVKTGAETARLEGHTSVVVALCTLADGRLASGSWDNTIRLWDVKTGVETVLQSPAELGRAIGRLEEVQALAAGLPSIDRLPAIRITALARFAGAAKAQALARLPDDRRIAILLAFIRTLEASAHDDVLDLFDVVVTGMLANARFAGQRERLGSIRDLDAAALKLRQACAIVLDEGTPDDAVRQAVFDLVSREAAMARIESLARPQDDQYFKELRAQHRRLRFLPSLLRTISFGAAPAGRPVLDAIEYLRTVVDEKPRPGAAPTAFVPEAWKPQVRTENDALDMTGYRLCLLDRMRGAIRRRDLFVSPSFRFGDPRKGLLDGAAWDAARPAVCRTLGVSSNATEEMERLSRRLDEAFRHTASNLPQNASVRIEQVAGNPDLILSPLDKLEEPPSLVALRAAIDARMPRVDLPEQVLEIHTQTSFAGEFSPPAKLGRAIAFS